MKLPSRVLLLALSARCLGIAQTAPAPLTLSQAVQRSVEDYPAVRAAAERAAATSSAVQLAKTAYLPRADFLGQVDRATRNNVFGLVLPLSGLPSISGPVLGTNNLTSVWGSAVGLSVSWEPFDFGLRQANVDAAQSASARDRAGQDVARLEVGAAAAEAFLTLLAAQQKASAARAGVDRLETVSRVVAGLAAAGLRPGADAARARAEVALAQAQLIRAEEDVSLARVSLSQFLGVSPSDIAVTPGPLLEPPPAVPLPSGKPEDHPAAREQSAAVDGARSAERAVARAYFPRFNLQAATYARGTGARTDGTIGGAAAGLGPNIQNWALGMSVTFPAFDLPANRARRQIALHHELSEAAQYQRTLRDLAAQRGRAEAELAATRNLVDTTLTQLEAARAAEQQATARYKSGLGGITEVAEAERLLTQAEADEAVARLGVWRGLLGVAAASGDLKPFLDLSGR